MSLPSPLLRLNLTVIIDSFGIVMPMPHPPDEADVPMHVCLAATIKFIQQGRQIVATYPSHGVM